MRNIKCCPHLAIRCTTQRRNGFTYIGLLILIAIMGASLAGTGILFHQQSRREKEKQLLFVGDQYRRAIGLYYTQTPGGAKKFPRTLEDLLADNRYPVPRRYLRRIYADPLTGSLEWVLVKSADGGISGVHSLSEEPPAKVDNFPTDYEAFAGATRYAEWKFVFAPVAPVVENKSAATKQ